MGSVDGTQQPALPGSIGNPNGGEREPGELPQQDQESKQCNESINAPAQREHLPLPLDDVPVDPIDGDHFGAGGGQPTACGGARDASSGGLMDVARRSDEIAQAMVVRALISSCGAHSSIMVTTACRTIPIDDGLNSGVSGHRNWRELAQGTPECRGK